MSRWLPTLLLAAFFGAGLAGATGEADNPWIHGVFTGKSPRTVVLPEAEAWQHASNLADHTYRAFVLIGEGQSMQPLYAPGTILVMEQLPFAKLERGQTVLYRNQSGKVVAHVLVAKARDGWRIAGLNNQSYDLEPVQAANLVGVVIAAYQPLSSGRSLRVASVTSP
jgi:hypothetical protein